MLSKTTYRKLRRITTMSGLWALLEAEKPRAKKSVKASRLRRSNKIATRSTGRSAVRKIVEARSPWICECGCGVAFGLGDDTQEMDHFYGRQYESRETCWVLRRCCHRNKTENTPSRAYWDRLFAEHCLKYGFAFRPRLTKVARNVRPFGEQESDRPKAQMLEKKEL